MKSEARGPSPINPAFPLEPSLGLADRENRVGLPLLKNIAEDQKALGIALKHLRFFNAHWLVLAGGTAAQELGTDTQHHFLHRSVVGRSEHSVDGGRP